MNIKDARNTNPNAVIVNSGILFDVFNPKLEDIDINDIAHALSNICRFGGHSPKFYSVAQHCVICSLEEASAQEQLELLMHDASEGYLIDVPSPIKRNMLNYIEIEENLLSIIFKKYELNFPLSEKVHAVDSSVLSFEFSSFFDKKDEKFEFWTPEESKKAFLERFFYLKNKINK